MQDIQDWLTEHDGRLTDIAEATDLDPAVVRLMAALLLAGLEDEQVFKNLQSVILSVNGRRDPLRNGPEALEHVRVLTSEGA